LFLPKRFFQRATIDPWSDGRGLLDTSDSDRYLYRITISAKLLSKNRFGRFGRMAWLNVARPIPAESFHPPCRSTRAGPVVARAVSPFGKGGGPTLVLQFGEEK
jgi:hypothetical protein